MPQRSNRESSSRLKRRRTVTYASLPAVSPSTSISVLVIWWLVAATPNLALQLVFIAALFALGVRLCDQIARKHGVHDDGAIVIDMQRAMVAASPCDKVISLKASHSPFLSMPDELVDALESA